MRNALRSAAILLLALCSYAPLSAVQLRNDQVRPICDGKRAMKHWVKDLAALTTTDITWMNQSSHATKTLDFTGDGVPDTLEIIATQYVRECDVKADLPYKEVHVTLKNGSTGQTQLWDFRGGLPDHYTADLAKHEITLHGTGYDGLPWERTLPYNH